VLRAAGLVGLAGGAAVLAGCSGDTSSGAASQPPVPAASSSAAPGSSASAAGPSTKASRKAASKPSGPSLPTSQVPVGGGVVMGSADYVVTQPSRGSFKAFSKICTHQGCPLARVANGQIQCDCHNSAFSITDGSVLAGPAQSPLPEFGVKLSGGSAYVQA
jgi:Rieske Fe-S protein